MRPDRPTNPRQSASAGRIEAQRPLPDEFPSLPDGPSLPPPEEQRRPVPEPRPTPGVRRSRGERKHSRRRKVFKRLGVGLVVVLVAQFLSVVSYNWFTPPRTSFMLQTGEPTVYQYVSIDHISRLTLAATIAHEDEQLGTRAGAFTWDQLTQRADAWRKGEKDPSGSTIPQQLAKNIYLWPSQDPVRKSLEAGLSTELSFTVPAKRVLELYLNYAQFAPKLYGICAASWYYFNGPPWALTDYQSAQLMGVLPLPDLVRRSPAGGIDLGADANPAAWDLINGAANVWVPRQIEGMGGWQATVATVGITDTANDHAAQRTDADSCSTMPESVAKRIASETGH